MPKCIRLFWTKIKSFYEKDDYAISIIVALIIVLILSVYTYVVLMKPNEFISLSILDENKEAENYPELLRVSERCCLWIRVENHMEASISCRVLIKITKMPIQCIPLQVESNLSYDAFIDKGGAWEKLVELSFNETGDFHLVFELWVFNKRTGEFEFSDNFCVLNVKVMEA